MKKAVLLPCYNEEAAIEAVVQSFHAVLPDATVYVYDNNSADKTAEIAARAGAVVRREPRQGKGHVIRRMFADIDADIYILADGDGTYESSAASAMVDLLINNNLDMVVGVRASEDHQDVYRRGHRFGNRLLTTMVQKIFGLGFTDMLSGYRVMSRRFVKTFPANASGFEIETELTIHALSMQLPVAETQTRYFKRPEGSASKLSTYRDGLRIMAFIAFLFHDAKPFAFFGLIALGLSLLSLVLGIPVVLEYFDTGLVDRLPTAVLSMGLMISALLSFSCGLIMENVSRGRKEFKRLTYLGLKPPADS